MFVNIWLAISDAAQDVVIEYLTWDFDTGPYTGPLRPRSQRLFRYMDDQASRRRLFEKPVLQSVTYNLWSIEFIEDNRDSLQAIRDELDFLMSEYPAQIAVCGAWHWEGDQIGTRRPAGTPYYPLPDWLWRFMPAEWGATSNDDLVDVNLVQGQNPRDFS